ncbi:minor tail protein [Microbacterium phage Alyxandracam]|uniref:Minor tail protein n=1 Tax=Microbacterium phage Alyxandracam TaxID=2590933 RepID=A0A516KTG6_9CAUD|nr:minor tail protein [Microbacterium phage Alyxandracam]
MSFKLGTFDTNDIEGFKAILTEWPMLPVELQLDSLPAGDGSLFYRARMTETEWVFNLELTGSDVADVLATANLISAQLNPLLQGGPQDFTPNAMDPFIWQGVLGAPIKWERDKVVWFAQDGVCRLLGSATVTTPNPYGYAVGEPVVLSGDGELDLVGSGNTTFYPVLEFRGVLSAAQTLSVGSVEVSGPLTAAQTLVLDFEAMDFYIKTTATGARVRNVADRFTTFERLEGVALSLPVSISGGTFTEIKGTVPSRRI